MRCSQSSGYHRNKIGFGSRRSPGAEKNFLQACAQPFGKHIFEFVGADRPEVHRDNTGFDGKWLFAGAGYLGNGRAAEPYCEIVSLTPCQIWSLSATSGGAGSIAGGPTRLTPPATRLATSISPSV